MQIAIVVDSLGWGTYYAARAAAEICEQKHHFEICDIQAASRLQPTKYDLVVAWIDSAEQAIDRIHGHGSVLASRITGWKGVYRSAGYPMSIRSKMVGVLCCSPELEVAAKKLYPKAFTMTIMNGVDPDKFYPAEKLGRGWGWVGREHDEQKGIHMRRRIDDQYIKKSSGGPRRLIFVKGQKRDAHNKVVPSDWPTEMRLFYQSRFGYFRTSTHEGSSNCLLEAMACGLPVVATPTGVAFRALNPRYLCSATKHMVREMKVFDRHPDLAAVVGKYNRQTILLRWCWSQRKDAYLEFFEKCLG